MTAQRAHAVGGRHDRSLIANGRHAFGGLPAVGPTWARPWLYRRLYRGTRPSRCRSSVPFDLSCRAMGESKRRREAVLKGPCPCGSGMPASLCCFNGHDWHKPPVVLGLKTLPPAGRVEKCYMRELGSCVPPISGEHIISDSVCRVLKGEGEFSISGVPWLEAGEEKIMAPPKANCLCTKHNSALSPLDAAAHYFFASLKSYLEHDAGSRHAIISGHDLERWLLKTAKAAAVSRNLARGREPLSVSMAVKIRA